MNETEPNQHNNEHQNWKAPDNSNWRSPEQGVDINALPKLDEETSDETPEQPAETESTVEAENTEQRFVELRHSYTQALENYKYEAKDRYAREQQIHQEIQDPNVFRDLEGSQGELAQLAEQAKPYEEAIAAAKQELNEFLAQNPDIAERRKEHLLQTDKQLTELNYKYGQMRFGMPGPENDNFPKLTTEEQVTQKRAELMEDPDYQVLNLERAIANPNLQAKVEQEPNQAGQ